MKELFQVSRKVLDGQIIDFYEVKTMEKNIKMG